MRTLSRRSPRLVPALLVLLAACSTEPAADSLAGSWFTAPEDLSPTGWYQTRLSFRVPGVFVMEVRSYGLYPGQGRNDLSAYSRISGRYLAEGDQLAFRPSRLVWWDRFYGPDSPEHIEEPYRTSLYDDARYTLEDGRLLLSYVSYPADAPVTTIMELDRED